MTRPNETPHLFIGLDPGKVAGMALYDPASRELVQCRSGSFWNISQIIEEETFPSGMPDRSLQGDAPVPISLVVVEDSRRLPIYARHRRKPMTREARDRLCRNVGRIDRDIELWDAWLKGLGYLVLLVEPSRESKWNAETLRRITGYAGQTNQHGRDAARLVFGLRRVPDEALQAPMSAGELSLSLYAPPDGE